MYKKLFLSLILGPILLSGSPYGDTEQLMPSPFGSISAQIPFSHPANCQQFSECSKRDFASKFSSNPKNSSYSVSPYGTLDPQINRLKEEKKLELLISKRQEEINIVLNHWKPLLDKSSKSPFSQEVKTILQKGSMSIASKGNGAAYILFSESGFPRFVIKPFDEEMYCLNNRKSYASPFHTNALRVRPEIPLYQSVEREALSFSIAHLLGLDHVTPEVHLMILSSNQFHELKEDSEIPSEKEKFCSVQRYIPSLTPLSEMPKKGIVSHESFQELLLFLWVIHDTDAHLENICTKKEKKGHLRLVKIDNALALPETNGHMRNCLIPFPHMQNTLCPSVQEKICSLSIESVKERVIYFGLEDCLEALIDRIEVLQKLALRHGLTLDDIDFRLRLLGLPKGKNLALSRTQTPLLRKGLPQFQ